MAMYPGNGQTHMFTEWYTINAKTKAIEDAWKESQKDASPPASLRVEDILVSGNNPITEYSVIVKRHP